MTKTKLKWILPAVLLAVLAAGYLAREPLYARYRDVTFYWTEHSPAELEVKHYAEEQGICYGRYPQRYIDLYAHNPETREFVLSYPFREQLEQEPLTVQKGELPLLLQWDTRWGYAPYGSDCLAVTGCGPTCLAMVGLYYTGDTQTLRPDRVARFAEERGYYARGYGSSWTLISQGAGELGLRAEELPLVKKKLTDALEAGKPVILAMGPGDFTTSGHYIVLTGLKDGLFTLNDPNSRIRSEKLWSYEELEPQIRNIWAISEQEAAMASRIFRPSDAGGAELRA